jgi:leucyl aminopeptidase
METVVSSESVGQYHGDALIVGVLQKTLLSGPAAEANAALGGLLQQLMDAGEVRGRAGELTILHTQGRMPVTRVAAVGLGELPQLDLHGLRRAMGLAARQLRDRGCRRVAAALLRDLPVSFRPAAVVRALIEGASMGLYRSEERKTEPGLPNEFDELRLIGVPEADLDPARAVAVAAHLAGEATNYARLLVNLPANEITPARLAQEALQIATDTGLKVRVLEPDELQQVGLGALLAVGQGSVHPPRLIVLEHRRGREDQPSLAFVGKGITFDSGGLSIKPAADMHVMKSDMAGAAAVLAAMRVVAQRDLPVNLLGLIPAAENLPSGTAYRPGDVVRVYGGKTVEIISTDAEGRMILADALVYAKELGATHLVDVATLTGACIIALGHVAAGVLGNDNALVEAVLEAGEQAGERMWRLPLFPEYRRQLDSKVADLKNVGGRPAGTIVGALFLKEFVDELSWVHIDIAGTAFSESDQPHQVEGGTGASTRTLIALAERLSGGSI